MPRLKRFNQGGDVDELLKMLNQYGSIGDPKKPSSEAVASPETVVGPFGGIHPPESENNYVSWDDLTQEEIHELVERQYGASGRIESTPLVDLGVGLAAYFAGPAILKGAQWAYSPMLMEIPGLGGVTGDAVLNAYMAYEGLTDMPEAIKELKENPNLKTLGRVGMDLLMSAPAIRNVSGKVKGTVDAVAGEKNLAKTKEALYNPKTQDLGYADVVSSEAAAESGALRQLADGSATTKLSLPSRSTRITRGDAEVRQALGLAETPTLQQLAKDYSDNILLSDKSIPTLGESRIAPLIGHGLTTQPSAMKSLSERLVDAGLYKTTDAAELAMSEIRNPSMNTILPTSGKTIGEIMQETESSLIDYYTNPLAKNRLTEIYSGVRGSDKVIPSSLPGLSRYHADPADLLKYKENYGLSGVEILDELYNQTGMLPRYYASTDVIKGTPSFADLSKGISSGIYDEPFEKFYSRRIREQAAKNPDPKLAKFDLAMADILEKKLANSAAAAAAPDPVTGVQKVGFATGGMNAVGALETFGLSKLAEMMTEGTKVPISYAENFISDVIYHELNHLLWGKQELPIEIVDSWTPYLTKEATGLAYKGGSQLDMTRTNVLGGTDPKGVLQYKSQPEEIQARMGQTRRHLEVSLGYTKEEIENIALAAREEGGEAMLGKQGGMSFFGVDNGAGGKYIHPSLSGIENKLKELGIVNENRSLEKVLDDLTEAAKRSDEDWYNRVIGGGNEEAKAQSLMGLLWRVPVWASVTGTSALMMNKEEGGTPSYEKGGILQSLMKGSKDKYVKNKVRALKKKGKSLKEAVAIALKMWEGKKKKEYAEGGAIEGWGVQTNFSQDPNALQPVDVEEIDKSNEELEALIPDPPPTYEEETFGSSEFNVKHQELGIEEKVEKAGMGGYDEAIMASELDQFANEAIEKIPIFRGWAQLGKFIGEEATNLIVGDSTGQDRKTRQIISAGIFSPHKLLAMREADKTGEYHYIEEEPEEVVPHEQTDFWSAERPEEGWAAANGIKIKKKKYDNGGILETLRNKRAERRLKRAKIKNIPNEEVLDYLAGKEDYAGFFRHLDGNVYLNPAARNMFGPPGADDSVIDHELIHRTQYGPLKQLAGMLGFDTAGRIQDKESRRAFKDLFKSVGKEGTILDGLYLDWQRSQNVPEDELKYGAADYMLGRKAQDVEFDAILKSGLASAEKRGYDLSDKSFDEIKEIFNRSYDEGNMDTNMGHLGSFFKNTKWSDSQKDIIMRAIKANLGRKAYTAADAKVDLR